MNNLTIQAHFDPVVLKLISILRRALPERTDEDIFWGTTSPPARS